MIKKIKCSLFKNKRIGSGPLSNFTEKICMRDRTICEAFCKKKVKDIKCNVLLLQLNNFDKILFNRGKLKIKMAEVGFYEFLEKYNIPHYKKGWRV